MLLEFRMIDCLCAFRNHDLSVAKIVSVNEVVTSVLSIDGRRVNAVSYACRHGGQRRCIPIVRDHTDFRPLVAGLQFHENPIFAKCLFTLPSRSATRLTICGIGVS